ncbi:MAG: sortase, partial [Dehalococcoidia bacterium]
MQIVLRAGFSAALLAMMLVLVACGGTDATKGSDQTGSTSILPTVAASTARESPPVAAETPATPTDLAPPPPAGVLLERVVVPSVKVDAPVEVKGVDGRGAMEDPSGKNAVAWYDFSEFPGFGGNAVFSGHVDWYTGELGPFGRLKELKDGDEIMLKLSDGMEMMYRVVSTTTYEST